MGNPTELWRNFGYGGLTNVICGTSDDKQTATEDCASSDGTSIKSLPTADCPVYLIVITEFLSQDCVTGTTINDALTVRSFRTRGTVMSRTTLTLAGVVLGVGCLVVFVRAQDASTGEPRPFPGNGNDRATLSDSGPTPATSRYNDFGSPPNEPTPAIRQSEFQTEAAAPEDRSTIPSVVKRPSVADRLQQVRESTNRPSNGKSAPRGSAVLGPVMTDPTNLRSPGLAEQPQGAELATPSGTSNSANADDEPRSGGSILKKSDLVDPNGGRQTARRLLRSPNKPTAVATPKSTMVPTQPATSAVSPAQVEQPQTVLQSRGPELRLDTHGPSAL
jgi:hypothetical protein